jgi:diacylglycerol kinase (ATP)
LEKKAILVVNPISGDVDKTLIIAAADEFSKTHGFRLTQFETTGDDDISKIRALYKELNPERIIIIGGDGTVKLVAEALEENDAVLGLLPAGSANGLSVDLDFPKSLEEQLEIAFGKHYMELDMICINNKRSLHLSDIGLNAELIKNYENSSIRGKIGYAIQAMTTLSDVEAPFHSHITADGNSVEADSKMIVIANSQRYGTGVTINPLGKMDDGKFEIVILHNLDLLVFGRIVAGNMPLETGDVEIISTDKATITTDVPVHFQVDGEYYGEVTTLDIRMLPKCLKLAVPVP